MYGYIYKTTNLVNGKIYVGQHKGKYTPEYLGSGILINRAIEKYGVENFKNEVLEWCTDKDNLCEQEKYWIKTLKPFPNNGKGYNLSAGGEFGDITAGYTEEQIKEWKLKISKANKGNQSWLGKRHTEETKRKISERRKGTKASESTRKNISKGITGGTNPRARHFMVTFNNGDTKIFETCNDATSYLGISQWLLCKMAKGDKSRFNKLNIKEFKEINRHEYR